jgi:hypothetical protein
VKKNLNLAVNVDPKLPAVVEIDDIKLSQILINILSNAVKFTPNGGSVTLSATLIAGLQLAIRLFLSHFDTFSLVCLFLKVAVRHIPIALYSSKSRILVLGLIKHLQRRCSKLLKGCGYNYCHIPPIFN